MAAAEDFLSRVLPWVAGCPAILAEQAVIDAACDFCAKSGYWREDILLSSVTDEVPALAGFYQVAPSLAGSDISTLTDPISFDGDPVYGRTPEWLDREYSKGWRTLTGTIPKYFNQTDDATFQLVPYPTTVGVQDIRVTLILMPDKLSATPLIGDIILQDWVREVGWGAIATLKGMAGQSWADPKAALNYQIWFDNACDEAQSMALNKFKDSRFKRRRTTRGSYF